MRVHRAVTLGLMLLLAGALILWAIAVGVSTISARSLIALVVVLGFAAVAGAAFSFRRYFPRRR